MFIYSIIIPHKNCPDLLKKCVDSIPEREDVQIIVVDDNSDESKKPQLSRKDVEIILLDAEHSKGAGRARNVGLQHAKGKWLLFADADDYYTDCLSGLLDKYADDNTTDTVYLNASMFDEKGNVRQYATSKLIEDFNRKIPFAEMHLRYSLWTPWSRMVKRDMVERNHIMFDELPACNDKMFCLYCSYYARSIAAEDSILYMYYKPTQGSQTDKKRNFLMLDGLLDVRVRTLALYNKVGYKPLPSLYELVHHSRYTEGIPADEIEKKYSHFLQKANITKTRDLYRYYSSHFRVLRARILRNLKSSRYY